MQLTRDFLAVAWVNMSEFVILQPYFNRDCCIPCELSFKFENCIYLLKQFLF